MRSGGRTEDHFSAGKCIMWNIRAFAFVFSKLQVKLNVDLVSKGSIHLSGTTWTKG